MPAGCGGAVRPENRVTARSKLPQKKCTGLTLPMNRARNSLKTRSVWSRAARIASRLGGRIPDARYPSRRGCRRPARSARYRWTRRPRSPGPHPSPPGRTPPRIGSAAGRHADRRPLTGSPAPGRGSRRSARRGSRRTGSARSSGPGPTGREGRARSDWSRGSGPCGSCRRHGTRDGGPRRSSPSPGKGGRANLNSGTGYGDPCGLVSG
jgi:hypothetical protein